MALQAIILSRGQTHLLLPSKSYEDALVQASTAFELPHDQVQLQIRCGELLVNLVSQAGFDVLENREVVYVKCRSDDTLRQKARTAGSSRPYSAPTSPLPSQSLEQKPRSAMSKPSRSALRPIDAAFLHPKEDIKPSGEAPTSPTSPRPSSMSSGSSKRRNSNVRFVDDPPLKQTSSSVPPFISTEKAEPSFVRDLAERSRPDIFLVYPPVALPPLWGPPVPSEYGRKRRAVDPLGKGYAAVDDILRNTSMEAALRHARPDSPRPSWM